MSSNPGSEQRSPERPDIGPNYAALPGEVYVLTDNYHLIRAWDGGGLTMDAIDTFDQWTINSTVHMNQKFKLWRTSGQPQPTPDDGFAFQTQTGNFVTAVGGGGRTTDVIHTDATQVQAWEEFSLEPVDSSNPLVLAIRTKSGNFVTAVGMGGQSNANAIHTDATAIGSWEKFLIRKCGDLGSGLQYYLIPYPSSNPILAVNGGNRTQNAFTFAIGSQAWGVFTLRFQEDGSYAIQVPDGHYITAVNGGGMAYGTADSDNLQTNRDIVQAWEKFRFIERLDGMYCIQTVSGYYLKLGQFGKAVGAEGEFSTDISDINAATPFALYLAGL